jgi:hypothetical protein
MNFSLSNDICPLDRITLQKLLFFTHSLSFIYAYIYSFIYIHLYIHTYIH